jgi:uncharacterized protein (TIGR02757 family)
VHPDPLEFLYSYSDIKDREIAGLVASSLAYGRVSRILKSTGYILEKMGVSPYRYLIDSDQEFLKSSFAGFKHRFTNGDEVAALLFSAARLIKSFGSLNKAFLDGYSESDPNIIPALLAFCKKIYFISGDSCCTLVPLHTGKSAFKRINLYLRWMVRKDMVDPGGWHGIPASKLLVPLDTHMYRISTLLELTSRKQADMKTAIEITESFKKIEREDPVKYDFALTRAGINRLPVEVEYLH